MIGWVEVYKVVEAMVPLYVALILGYGSVRWWKIFSPDQCDAINRLVCYFTLPLFTLHFTAHIDPFHMNFRFIAADGISKLLILTGLAVWSKLGNQSDGWSITSYSLCTLTNALVVGAPLVRVMYGDKGVDLVVQSSVVQAIVWLTVLLCVLEFRRSADDILTMSGGKDVEAGGDGGGQGKVAFRVLMTKVWLKLATNPNVYACVLGLAWAFVANRWNIEMPNMVEGSILIMSKAGTGTAMFNMGIFMALQEKLIACGTSLTVIGMVLRFVAGPAAMALGSIAVGLHGDILRVAIIQAAVPQSITSFIFAKEYGLHADVLSTAVIFGTIVSLPVLVAYYAVLEFVN